MQLVLEGGDDPEVAAAASDGPEQLLVLPCAGPQEPSVGGRDVGRDQVVARQSMTAVEPAQPAAEREPRDPSRRHHSERRRQAERLGGTVELSQGEPGFGPGCPRLRINPEGLHAGQVEHDGAVAHRVPRDAVTAPAHRERKLVSTCEPDAADHVGRVRTADHGERPPVDHAVEHRASRVVATVAGAGHLPPQPRPELAANRAPDRASVNCHRTAPLSCRPFRRARRPV